MIAWHHWLNGHELEQTQGESAEQRSLVCCRPWGGEESDMTQQLNTHTNISTMDSVIKESDPVNLKCNMLSESQTEKHVLYMLHGFLEKAKQQAQKRDQWMPRSMCGRRGGPKGCKKFAGRVTNHSTAWLILVWLHDHAFVKTHRTDSTLLCEKCIRTGTQTVVTGFSQNMPCLLI